MFRRSGIVLVVGALVLLAGCGIWTVPSDGGGSGGESGSEVIDHFSNPPEELEDAFNEATSHEIMDELTLVTFDATVHEVTDEGKFVMANNDTVGNPAPLWKTDIVGYDELGLDVDEECFADAAVEAESFIEDELVGVDAVVFFAEESDEHEAGLRVYPLSGGFESGASASSVLVERGYALSTGDGLSAAQERAQEGESGIWQCTG